MRAQSPQPASQDEDAPLWPRALALGLAVALCYANSLHGPFLLDDPHPGEQLSFATRPLVRASFALNRAVSGDATWSFHVFNALVHLGCGFLLMGVLRRGMVHAVPGLAARTRTNLAFVTTLLWLCHPLQTGAVTYLSQRSETMTTFFLLALLYAFQRSVARPRPWAVLTFLALALGFATKEMFAIAPVVLFLYDALLLAGGGLAALRQRRGFYAALALATIALVLVFTAPVVFLGKDSAAGFGLETIGSLQYARTQPGVLLHYLRLVFWPHPLCFDPAWSFDVELLGWLPQAAVVGVLLAATAVLCLRRSWIGFAGATFFVVLAPTSSFVPILDPAFEHRMYLPLASVLLLVVVGAWRLQARFLPGATRLAPLLATVAALALTGATIRRNHDYRTALDLWQVTVACAPHNPRAHDNLGAKLLDAGRTEEAIPRFLDALRLHPIGANLGIDYLNLGIAYVRLGQPERAIPFLERAEEWLPTDTRAPHTLGKALAMKGDHEGALACYERSLSLPPNLAEEFFNLAESLRALARFDEALVGFQEAGRLAPELAAPYAAYAETVCVNPAATLEQRREAARCAQKADEMTGSTRPEYAALRDRVGAALGARDEPHTAGEQDPAAELERHRRAVEQAPDDAQARFGLATALGRLQRTQEAIREYEEALRLAPERQEAHVNLAALLAREGRNAEALEHARKALAIPPDSAEEHFNLGQALHAVGQLDAALAAFREAIRLAPGMPEPYAGYAKTVCLKPDATDEERREALRMARKAYELAGSERADFLEIGAEARAALGEYAEAAQLLEQALALPGPQRNQAFAERLRARRAGYLREAER